MPQLMASLMEFDDDAPSSSQTGAAASTSPQSQAPDLASSQVNGNGVQANGVPNTRHELDASSEALIDEVRQNVSSVQERSRLLLTEAIRVTNRRIINALQAALDRRQQAILDSNLATHEQDLESLEDMMRSALAEDPYSVPDVPGSSAEEEPPISYFAVMGQQERAYRVVRDQENSEQRRLMEDHTVVQDQMALLLTQLERQGEERRRQAVERGAGEHLPPRE